LITVLTLLFSFTYFQPIKHFNRFYLSELENSFKNMMNYAFMPIHYFTGHKEPNSYNVTQEQYDQLIMKVREKQLSRNPLVPYYQHNFEKVPQLTAIAGPDLTVQEEQFSEKATVTLDGSQSYLNKGEITVYQWWRENQLLAETPQASVELPIGEWEVTLIVKNKFRNRGTDVKKIMVFPNETGLVNRALAANGGIASTNGSLPFIGVGPSKAIDGNTRCFFKPGEAQKQGEDCWINKAPTKDYYWQVDLGETPAHIRRIMIHFRKGFESAEQTNHLVLSGSAHHDFKQFEVLGTRQDEPYPKSGSWILSLPETKNYRYIRISKTKDTYTSFAEVEVWCEKES
jgi:hypothetical protein